MFQGNLTKGAIKSILDGEECNNAVLQVLSVRKIQTPNSAAAANDRYRLTLSDGESYSAGMLATQLNPLVAKEEFDKNCVISLDRYICSAVQGRKLIIALELQVIGMAEKGIGSPVNIDAKNREQQNKGNNEQQNNENDKNAVNETKYRPQDNKNNNYSANKPSYDNNNNNNNNNNYQNESRSPGGARISPISSVNPYQNRWTLKARVTNKSPMRHYTNAKGEGKLMSFDLTDSSGEIRCTCFGDTADRLNNSLEINKVYFFSNGQVKMANKQYSNLANNYEITFGHSVNFSECVEKDDSIPMFKMDFIKIKDIEDKPKDAIVDVIGIINSIGNVDTIQTRAGKMLSKRSLMISDESQTEINCTLWGKTAEDFNQDADSHPIIAIKGAKVGDFGGKNISAQMSSLVTINPDITEAHHIRGWYDSVGCNTKMNSLSSSGSYGEQNWSDERKPLSMLKEDPSQFEKPVYFITRGYITLAKKDTCLYDACPSESCNKKLVENNGTYNCEKCQQEYDHSEPRLMLQMNIGDTTGKTWLVAFNDTATQLLEASPQEMKELQDSDESAFLAKFEDLKFKPCLFKIRAKADNYQNELRVRCGLNGFKPVNYVSEGNYLLKEIRAIEGQ